MCCNLVTETEDTHGTEGKQVEKEVVRLLNAYLYHEGKHAKQRMRERNITRMEIEEVLRQEKRDPRCDKRNEAGDAWKYAFKGITRDHRKLRIIVFLENGRLEIVTVIDVKGGTS